MPGKHIPERVGIPADKSIDWALLVGGYDVSAVDRVGFSLSAN